MFQKKCPDKLSGHIEPSDARLQFELGAGDEGGGAAGAASAGSAGVPPSAGGEETCGSPGVTEGGASVAGAEGAAGAGAAASAGAGAGLGPQATTKRAATKSTFFISSPRHQCNNAVALKRCLCKLRL